MSERKESAQYSGFMIPAESYQRVKKQHIALAKKHELLVRAARALVHARKTSIFWLEHTPEYDVFSALVEKKRI